jgi:CubicO group peptidase (beta-lactamase class C family)
VTVTPEGFVADGFEEVRTAFARSFRELEEIGAAFSAVRDGEPVVDLWGGVADAERQAPWSEDTLQLIFSGTKGLVALCLLMLVDRELLDGEAPVSHYWPEFATAGKRDVRVEEVVSHRARLPAIRRPVTHGEILDGRLMASLIASQPQEEDPRAATAYHPLTYGWMCGELVRRIDGRSIGRFFAEEVAQRLGLEIWIGLPADLEPRVSTLSYTSAWRFEGQHPEEMEGDELLARMRGNPPLFQPEEIVWNRPDFHAAEIPGANAIATARSMARLYGCLARGGELDGVRLLRPETLRYGRECLSERSDGLAGEWEAFGFGFELQSREPRFGPPADGFGHTGAGGSIHGAWPELGVGFSYAMNGMRDADPLDPRAQALLSALHAALVPAGEVGARA